MDKTIEDKDYILDRLCDDFKKKLYRKGHMNDNGYIVTPKSKTMYIIKRENNSKK